MSTAAIFIVVAAPVHPLVIAAGRVLVASAAWAFVARGGLKEAWRVVREPGVLASVVGGGVLLALHFGTWIWCLSLTSVAHGTVLVATQPLFAGLFGRLLGDRATRGLWVGTGVAVAGTMVMTRGMEQASGVSWQGDALAILAAAAAALYLLAGRRVRGRVSLPVYMALLNPVAFAALALAVLVTGTDLWPAGARPVDAFAILWLGLVPGLIGHGVLNWASRHLTVHTVSLAVLLEPVGATLLSIAFLGHDIAAHEVAGGALLLFGAGLGLRAGDRVAG